MNAASYAMGTGAEMDAGINIGRPPESVPLDQSTVGTTVRLRQDGLPDGERQYAMWMHLASLIAFMVVGPFAFAAPLIMWKVRNGASGFVEDHGTEVTNFALTGLLVSFLAVVPVIGWFGAPVWLVVGLISVIRGSIAANAGEYFRYPLTFRFMS